MNCLEPLLAASLASDPTVSAALAAAPAIHGVRIEFLLFGLTLAGIALFHHHTLRVAWIGMVVITGYRILFTDFHALPHLHEEASLLLNLLGLLLGFALLAEYFARSRIPDILPRYLPDDWKGGFLLLLMVWVASSFLDNIAAAIIGGTIARVVFQGRVHLGFLAAIVAASNAGGAWSVVGDTTTTMMWIAGKSPLDVLHAAIASAVAIVVCGLIAARQQDRYQRIQRDPLPGIVIDWTSVGIAALILIGAIVTNVWLNFPAAGVWVAILLGATVRRPAWHELPGAARGSLFLLSLVWSASLMPVQDLPDASWHTTLGLGFLSAVFDNIPLTKLAIDQGGYDWGMLAFAVGFGGSMLWFGSSAGVALATRYPEARSTAKWLKEGWHVVLAYVLGFFALLGVMGWHPQ